MDDFILDVLRAFADADSCDDVWWRTDGEYAPVTFLVNCNDVFFWGCSDCETVTRENIATLRQAYADCESWGAALFCARVRGMRPQGAWYSYLPREQWPLFDACGPARAAGPGNPYVPGGYDRGPYCDKATTNRAAKDQ